MTLHWSTHQLTEYFGAISEPQERGGAVQVAAERAAEALDAEIGGVVLDGAVAGCVGLGLGAPSTGLLDAADGATSVSLPGLGDFHAMSAQLARDRRDALVVCRFDEPFTGEERHMLLGMAQVLGLTLRSLDTLAVERALREEREREAAERLSLLDALTVRQHLLENLLEVQRAIAGRQPLPVVLDAITSGAAGLLPGSDVTLMLADPFREGGLVCASSSGGGTEQDRDLAALEAAARRAMSGAPNPDPTVPDPTATDPTATDDAAPGCTAQDGTIMEPAADPAVPTPTPTSQAQPAPVAPELAAPVVVDGHPVGCLVVTRRTSEPGPRTARELQQTLIAFAQQVSLALSDARALEAIEEAYHDPLTGLPSRALFISRLEQALGSGALVNVLFIDLDRFKAVNDSLGHAAGDELLAAVADRLRSCLRSADTPARLGGDEFAALVPEVPDGTAQAIAHRIIESLGRPFRIRDRDVFIGASVGIARGQAPEVGAAELLGDADVAMYRAKKSGAGKVTVFQPTMQSEALESLSLSSDLQHALADGELEVRYQPVVDLHTGRPRALEALLRWNRPGHGPVSPSVFVPLAEQSGLIHELGRWVLRQSLTQASTWLTTHPDVAVSVNVSARQIVDPGFGSEVADLLIETGVPADRLVLELTETALVTNLDAALSGVRELKELGTRLAVDDFGTGYSSLSHLRRFPVDLLKIDGSFVRSMFTDPREEALVRAVLGLGRSLQIPTVAEGIETAAQLEMLRANDCDFGQGYLLGRPMVADDIPAYLARGPVIWSIAALTA